MSGLRRAIPPLVILALVLAAGLTMFKAEDTKKLTAHFPRTISVYEGSEVRILGVGVGKVDKVTPDGTDVVVEMSYDAEVKVPAEAKAVIIAPSVVGDRFVQLTPAYDGEGPVLEDGSTLEVEDTSVPLELDQVYSSIDELTVALGPTGANRNGALSDLLEVTAENFAGQGVKFHQTIKDFGELSATLEDNKEELFSASAELQRFLSTLAENDTTVREFNQSLAQVSTVLAGERQELAAALDNLGVALAEVSGFVKENRDILGRDIKALNRVAKVLARQRNALDSILQSAPLALNNLYLAYNPQTGTLDTNSNMNQMEGQILNDPSLFLCTALEPNDRTNGRACEIIEQILPRPGALEGGGRSADAPAWDPTLGGLVEVDR